jgi:arylsulfatase A-like enzyme
MLTRRTFLVSVLAAATPKPNIVIIVSDDHGYGDISAHEHPNEIRTPHIDRIAKGGVRFTQGYANAYVCAPSRAAILTGTYPQRYGFFTASDSRAGLPLSHSTLADLLKKEGYATGAIGKWHLGLDIAHHPMKRGFDEFYGFLGHGGHDYFNLKPTGELYNSILRGYEPANETGYLTDNFGREAVSFIARHDKHPFFLYLAFNAVHAPMQAPEDIVKKYDTGDANRNTLLAMLDRENDAIGKVLDELERRKLDKNTLLFFVSDNGGARANSSNNGPLRGYKQSVYEGGIRVPFLVKWPARLKANSTSNEPVIFADIMPTIAAAAGAQMPAGRDGRNFLPILERKANGPLHENLYWDGAEGRTAIRSGRWKVINNNGRIELFDLEADRSEKNDLASQRPEVVARLRAAFDEWSKGNAPRITRGSANDEGEDSGQKKKKKKAR